ncbi:MAG: hypothetical protein ACMUIL_14010 [bacterium]
MKERMILLLTILTCCALALGALFQGDNVSAPDTTILELVRAAQKDDLRRYVACFCDELRISLENQVKDMGEEAFARCVMNNHRNLTGIAISDARSVDTDRIRVVVEFVYEGHDEIRSYILRRIRDEWKIAMITKEYAS